MMDFDTRKYYKICSNYNKEINKQNNKEDKQINKEDKQINKENNMVLFTKQQINKFKNLKTHFSKNKDLKMYCLPIEYNIEDIKIFKNFMKIDYTKTCKIDIYRDYKLPDNKINFFNDFLNNSELLDIKFENIFRLLNLSDFLGYEEFSRDGCFYISKFI
jgi:hypothetical protein